LRDLHSQLGGLTKTHVLISDFPGRVVPRKGLAGRGLAALIRRALPPAGGSSRKNETGFVF